MTKKTRVFFTTAAFASVLLFGFHNCAPSYIEPKLLSSSPPKVAPSTTNPPSNESSTVTAEPTKFSAPSGGEGYDGKPVDYINLTASGTTCPDGSDIQSMIRMSDSSASATASLVRFNCVDIAPQLIAAADLQTIDSFGSPILVYQSLAFYTARDSARAPSSQAPFTLLCQHTSTQGKLTTLTFSTDGLKAVLQSPEFTVASPLFLIVAGSSQPIEGTSAAGDRFALDEAEGSLTVTAKSGAIFAVNVNCTSPSED